MHDKTLIMDLAKLVIAAAWADGALDHAEINALKDLLFQLEEVSAEDWTVLNMYMDAPVSDAEREELLGRVAAAIHNSEDKALVLVTLEKLFQCDGTVTPEEQRLMASLKDDIDAVGTGIFSSLSSAFKSAIRRRHATVAASSLRETKVDDYVTNTVYYDVRRKQDAAGIQVDQPESTMRKLCLAMGLMAHVANLDESISAGERDAMRDILEKDWNVSKDEADLLVSACCDRAAKGLDYFRLSHGFFECTETQERRDFLKTLFRIANAANRTDNDEIEAIRRVAGSLKLSHQDFIDAKLTVPREDRKGL